jgi:Zn-dependent peptidase ImmA (M78 family)
VEQLAKFAVLEKPNLRHIMGVHIDYDIKFTDRMGAASVRGQGVENGLYVGLNTQYSIGRQLFWLIHEQCHLLLDHNGSFVQDPENYLKLMRNTEIHGQEAAAYLLSAELALPFVDISNMLDQGITDAEKLAEIFVVHPYQIMTRVIQITRKKYGDYGIYTGDDEAKKAYRDYTEDYYKILKLEPDDRADTAI